MIIFKSALISECTRYRYWLAREWDLSAGRLPFIMLNPSTADAELDDPTIRRCMSFARREGYGGISVHNLFAFRATSPKDMRAAVDPIGPMNDHHLGRLFDVMAISQKPIVAAWGAHGVHDWRDEAVKALARVKGVNLVCLGRTAAGHPRHPLYVKGDQPLEVFA